MDGPGCDRVWVLLPGVSRLGCCSSSHYTTACSNEVHELVLVTIGTFPCSGVSQMSSSAQTLASGFLAVISVNLVIGLYIWMAMKETPHQEPQPDPTFLADAKASINQPTSSQVSDDSKGKGKVE